MLIATSLAAALCASSVILPAADRASAAPRSAPPIVVTVSAPGITPTLLRYILGEADAIWRDAGVTFVWRSAPRDAVAFVRGADAPPVVPAMPNTLRLVIGDNAGSSNGETLPLGWIVFDDVTTPEQEVYVSYANATRFLIASRGVVGLIDSMPNAQREQLLGRAMGRALAHEIGHYLFASKAHTARGLMKATRTASEFFTMERNGFRIDPSQRQAMMARLRTEPAVASR
jgi:hypothetical protein